MYLSRQFRFLKYLLRPFYIILKNSYWYYKSKFLLRDNAFFNGKSSGNVKIGSMSSVRNSTLEGPIVIGSKVSIIKSQIERYTYLASNSFVINASIGPFCSIAHGVYIGLANHPVHGISTSPIFYSNLKQLGVSWRDQAAVVESYRQLGRSCCIFRWYSLKKSNVIH